MSQSKPFTAITILSIVILFLFTGHVDAGPYSFSVDRFHVLDNRPGGFTDEFDGNSVDPLWEIFDPTVVESGGMVTFSNPGEVNQLRFGNLRISIEMSYIGSKSSGPLRIAKGAGDLQGTSTWAPIVPDTNQFYGMGINIEETDEDISIGVHNFSPAGANVFGIPQGLGVSFGRFRDIKTGDFDAQAVSIMPGDVTGDILLRLSFDDDAGQYTAGFSLDGGLTFLSPFSAVTPSVVGSDPDYWYLGAESWQVVLIPPMVLIKEFVTRFYTLCLSRDPDSAGLDSWVSALLDGTLTGSDVAYGFVFSQEFIEKAPTDEEYLQVLYEAFFNRQPDPGGWQGWIDAIKNGASREDVLKGFIFAQEFAELCDEYNIITFKDETPRTPIEKIKAFVTRFYELCLDRDPDPAGLEGWANDLLNKIKTGADVAHGFIDSVEFINKNTTNDEYLTILYKAFFNRNPDQAGWDVWIEELNSGKERGYVLDGFLGSQEFIKLCENFGIIPF